MVEDVFILGSFSTPAGRFLERSPKALVREAGALQVANARIGLAENGGGLIGNDLDACAVTILEAVN
jgi:hypothetical protein